MNIRNKLLIQFSIFVVTILLIFSVGIFLLSSNYRVSDYYSRLQDKANTTAQLLLDVEEVDKNLLKIIDKNTLALYQEKIYIFNDKNELIYFNPPEAKPLNDVALINQIRLKRTVKLKEGEREVLGILNSYKGSNYVIIISALDKYGLSKIKNLKLVLIIGFIFGVISTFILGFIFAGRALAPISNVISQVKEITVTNLNQRVDEGNQKDEIAQLAITFNQMLQRIEDAFILQHEFVSNAAHELRTPFTVLLTEVDFTLMHDRDSEYYKSVLISLSKEIKKLSKLSNGLLDLARISFDKSTFNQKIIRIDELLVETCNAVLSSNNNYKININFNTLPENYNQLHVFGNEQLLSIAFTNLIDNACKFSESKAVQIDLNHEEKKILVKFSDKGIGIPKEDIDNIFQPFYRGNNTHFISGYGIGLALTSKIIDLHNGIITVDSALNIGSTFTVSIPSNINF